MLTRLALLVTAVTLAAAAALVPAANVPAAGAAVGNCTADATWPAARADLATRVVELVNQHRASKGLGALTTATWRTTTRPRRLRAASASG